MPLSKQQLERIGTAFIAERLYRAGLKFARPDIDEGIDLIVYTDMNENSFRAVPLQIKAFSDEEFYTNRKYLGIPDLVIIYLWHVGTDRPIRAFGMKYVEAERIVDQNGWSRNNGVYARTRGSTTLTAAISQFEIQGWRALFF